MFLVRYLRLILISFVFLMVYLPISINPDAFKGW